MTDRYILVKVREPNAAFPGKAVVVNGTVIMPHTNFAKIRKAIHEKSEEQFISVADICSHSMFMTDAETQQLEDIFNRVMARCKPNKKGNK